jgi:hypothetical protein
MRSLLVVPFTVALAIVPCLAQSREGTSPTDWQSERNVQDAITYERAKDRADALQARKEARHPEQFTHATPNRTNDDRALANEQRRSAARHSPKVNPQDQR